MSGISVHISTAEKFDREQLYAIFHNTHDNPWRRESFFDTLKSSKCLVASHENELVGLIIFSHSIEQADLLFVGVDAHFRNAGIAKQLIQEAVAQLKAFGVNTFFLEVAVHNTFAIRLYNSLSFKKVATRKDYYRHHDGRLSDAVVMSLDLN